MLVWLKSHAYNSVLIFSRYDILIKLQVLGDSTTEFCTEDTPANVSHATSHSDLSNLCALSDDGSSDHDNILAECIQSGMPQVIFFCLLIQKVIP